MLRLLLFRRANRILELEGGSSRFVDVFVSEDEEIASHTSFFKVNKVGNTNGFYFDGVKEDTLMFYIEDSEPKIQYEDKVCELLDTEIKFSCHQLSENEWCFECSSSNDSFLFIYKPYAFDPYDDDESDVNFGLWLISLMQDSEKLNRVINANN